MSCTYAFGQRTARGPIIVEMQRRKNAARPRKRMMAVAEETGKMAW
ncbi:MAG: hypothetical protein WC759_02930 [Candidatus Micrarchaeia archaeon]